MVLILPSTIVFSHTLDAVNLFWRIKQGCLHAGCLYIADKKQEKTRNNSTLVQPMTEAVPVMGLFFLSWLIFF